MAHSSWQEFTMNYEPFALNRITVLFVKTDTCNLSADRKFP